MESEWWDTLIAELRGISPIPSLDKLIETALKVGQETVEFDFKETLNPKTSKKDLLKLVRYITSFANTDSGGYLIIGISDDGVIKGLPDGIIKEYDQTNITAILNKYIAPVPKIQIYIHEYKECKMVIIYIERFQDVPHIVKTGKSEEDEFLPAGTILVRTPGATCGPIETETALRRLCDAIVKRHATKFAELLRLGSPEFFSLESKDGNKTSSYGANHMSLQEQADRLWSSDGAS